MNARRASLIIQNVNVSTKYLLKADVETREHNYTRFLRSEKIYIFIKIFFFTILLRIPKELVLR